MKYKGVTYHFCGKCCVGKFKADPAKYVAAATSSTTDKSSSKQ